jgi:hypothetical protein
VLHHNGHIRLNQTRIRRIGRDLFRFLKIIEAQMLGTLGGNREFVGTNRITIFKKDCDRTCASVDEALRMQQAS